VRVGMIRVLSIHDRDESACIIEMRVWSIHDGDESVEDGWHRLLVPGMEDGWHGLSASYPPHYLSGWMLDTLISLTYTLSY